MKTAVHITHETIKKVGGIGAVLNGLCSSPEYTAFFDRTVYYGPLFGKSSDLFKAVGKEGDVLFSSEDSHDSGRYGEKLKGVIEKYNAGVVYLKKTVAGEFNPRKRNVIDVLLVQADRMREEEIAAFKYRMWKEYHIQSELYESDRDYEQYLRIAVPMLDILRAVFPPGGEYYYFSHEYMGMFSALAVKTSGSGGKTIFTAHEVSTVRSLVEGMEGHDISFYNIMRKAREGQSLEEIFGSQKHNSRSELIKRAASLDRIFAVSDLVKDEYLFLAPETNESMIRVVYNGLSVKKVSLKEFSERRRILTGYVNTLLNYEPDVVLTHVARLVGSKGLWRDIAFLYLMDEILFKNGLKGVFILLSTAAGERNGEDVLRMEAEYGWPLAHRDGWPDLVGKEIEIDKFLSLFNARARALRGVFINQFGFSREACGRRVPAEAAFPDLRISSDAELGFSIYEPFGISQIENVPFGGTAVFSSSCGSSYFIEKVFGNTGLKPFVSVDFIEYGRKHLEYAKLRDLHHKERDRVEFMALSDSAMKIFENIPLTRETRKERMRGGASCFEHLGWDRVVKDYFIPNLP